MKRDDDDRPNLVRPLAAVVAALALVALVLFLIGCAVAIGDKSNAQVRINAPLDLETNATANRKDDEPKAKSPK